MDAEWITALVMAMGLPVLIQRPLMPIMEQKLWHKGMRRTNFKGTEIVTAGGLIIVVTTFLTGLTLLLFFFSRQAEGKVVLQGVLFLFGIVSVACWGWLDDASEDKEIKGFRGHFRTLWRERRVTSGMWKVWGGGSTAMLVAYGLTGSFWSWLLAACVIAATTNVLNLFDLRPARALKVFWLILLLGVLLSMQRHNPVSYSSGWLWLLPILISTFLMFRHDASGRMMLGDTGANVLGFAAGFALVQGVAWQGQAVFFALFLFLQVASEFVSFTQIIEKVKWLERMDRWGRSAEPDK